MNTIKSVFVLFFAFGGLSTFAQQFGATPEDSVECTANLSLYSEFYKQRNYVDAYEPWLKTYQLCPGSSVNRFIQGTVIVKNLINMEKDAAKRQELIDLLLGMWDKRAEIYGDAGGCMGNKAMDMLTYQPSKLKDAYDMFKKAVETGSEGKSFYVIPFYFFECAMANEKAGNITKEDVLEAYDLASTYLDKLHKANPKDTLLTHTMDNLDIAFLPYATCEEIVPVYEKKYEDNKNNVAFLEKVCKILDRKDCNEHELFFKATEALHALKPDPKTAYLMAKMCDGKKMYSDVINYLKGDVIAQIDNERDQIRACLLLAKACLSESKFSDARNAARKAVEINPEEGKAYILMGLMYASSYQSCGGDDIAKRAVYWAAVDKFRKAKEVDPKCAEEADKYIATFAAHFPTGNDLFFSGISEGSAYTVGCWIQERTTVRAR